MATSVPTNVSLPVPSGVREWIPGRTVQSVTVSATLGSLILINQYGEAFNRLVEIPFMSILWTVNRSVSWIGSEIALFLLFTLLVGQYSVIRRSDLRTVFRHGFLTGTFVFPVVALGAVVIGAVVWLVYRLVGLIFTIIGIVTIPLVWLLEHIVVPIVSFLALPFVWIWRAIVAPVLQFVLYPLAWLINHFLSPILMFVFRYLILPVGILVGGVVVAGTVLLVPAMIGRAYLCDLEIASSGDRSSRALFSHGVAFGLITFSALSTYILAAGGLMSEHPSFALVASFLIPLIFILRQNEVNAANLQETISIATYQNNLLEYWRLSKLGLVAQCMLLPLAFILYHVGSAASEGES